MITIVVEGLSELQEKVSELPDTINNALLTKSQAIVDILVQTIRDDKLSGGVLRDKSGLLRSSIEGDVEDSATGPTASVYVAGDVPYAAIQEYGGQTKAHIIQAINGKALAFNWQGKQGFFKEIHHPGSTIPEHSYMRSTLNEMQDDILSAFSDGLNEALQS